MKAVVYDNLREIPEVREVGDPRASVTGVVLRVGACGICRSDWHGWMGNDPDISLPHVPGHEIAGEIVEVGCDVAGWNIGERVTLPFVCGCGACGQCLAGDQQVCDRQFQPGFTAWGGFAEYVAIEYAETNLVRLPDEVDMVTASGLGCRFATSFRAVVDQGRVQNGQWVAVYGCGGVGLSAIIIAAAFGARVIAVDIADDKLEFARSIGADAVVNSQSTNAVNAIMDITGGGADLSIDALGHPDILVDSVSSLKKRGRHIQVGIMETGKHLSPIPVDKIIGHELEIFGSHGMQAHRYPEMLEMIRDGRLQPQKLIGKTIALVDAPNELTEMNAFAGTGVTVIDRF